MKNTSNNLAPEEIYTDFSFLFANFFSVVGTAACIQSVNWRRSTFVFGDSYFPSTSLAVCCVIASPIQLCPINAARTATSLYCPRLAEMAQTWLGATTCQNSPAGTPPAIVFVHSDLGRRGFSTWSTGNWRIPPPSAPYVTGIQRSRSQHCDKPDTTDFKV